MNLFNFFYKLNLMKIYMNDHVMNTQIFHLIMYDLIGHLRSQKVILCSYGQHLSLFLFILLFLWIKIVRGR